MVAQRLSMAAAAAANAASNAAGPLANNITSFTSAASNAAAVHAVTSQLQVLDPHFPIVMEYWSRRKGYRMHVSSYLNSVLVSISPAIMTQLKVGFWISRLSLSMA